MNGWVQVIIGAMLIVGGIWTVFDSTAKKIYLGAIIVGPIFIYRGIRNLDEEARETTRKKVETHTLDLPSFDDVRSPHEKPANVPEPKEVAEFAVDEKAVSIHVECQSCRKSYVYFPERTSASYLQFSQAGHSAAPCPRCGWFQSHMEDWTGEFKYADHWTEKYAMIAGFLVLASAGVLAFNFNKFYGAHAPIDPLERYYWFGNLAVLLSAVACGVVYAIGSYRKPNPNDAPVQKRIRRGELLGMPLEEVEALRSKKSSNERTSPTGIVELH